jgi:hypothetical protein
MRFRSKVVEIDAFMLGVDDPPPWFQKEVERGEVRLFCSSPTGRPDTAEISTLEGIMTGEPGDYVIKGLKDELYPCKADIFAMKYEAV